MKKWFLLGGAIVAEVAGTLTLRATVDHPAWVPVVVAAYAMAFVLLGFTLRAGMKIGAAYGIWGATGVALVALFGIVVFGERLGATALIGIGVIVAGVILIETGSHPDAPAEAPMTDGEVAA
jgi:small multidrug resistance pump